MTQGCFHLCQVCMKLTRWFWRRLFKISSMYICFYVFISPWKKAGPFIWTTWNPLTQKCIEPSLVENWPSCSGEEHFSHFVKVFYYFVLISSWKRAGPAFEQPWILFTQRVFVLSLVKIGQVVLEKQIFIFVTIFLLFHYYISLEKGATLHLSKLEFP